MYFYFFYFVSYPFQGKRRWSLETTLQFCISHFYVFAVCISMLLYFVVSYPFQGKRWWPLETTILFVGFYSMFIRNRMALQVFSAEYIIDCSMKNTILPNLADYRSFFHWSWVSNIVITCDKLALVNWYKTDVFMIKLILIFFEKKMEIIIVGLNCIYLRVKSKGFFSALQPYDPLQVLS